MRHKILFGYVILTAVIAGMVAVLFHERVRVQEIESESSTIGRIQNCINAAHRQITILATCGESVIVWDESDYHAYRERRLRTDSLLQQMKGPCSNFIRGGQIDTLRSLLTAKEEHLHGIMQVVRYHSMADSILLSHLPTPNTLTRSVTRKKKGIAGWFGKKDTIQVLKSPETLYSLNRKMNAIQEEWEKSLEARTDSLRSYSRELNRKLYTLITDLDEQAETAFHDKKRHILHLLNNLLDVYRLNESKETCNNVLFSLEELLGRVASGFSHLVNDKGILFESDFRNVDVILYGDMDRLSQIIDNLLSNALKFTDAGTIAFHAGYENGTLSLKVKDTGIGMNEETLSRIFRPFEKISTQTNANGFGLGLPITKGLVSLMGGTIEVESETGKGSTFSVSLPLPVSDKEIGHENPIIENPNGLPRYVLAIDDDKLQLEIVKEMLERNGVMCTTCSDAKELVRAMRKKDYDLLLTDIQMEATNGFEILALLRRSNIGNSRSIPVVAMTARGDKEKSDFTRSGFSDCIYKPFSMPELLSLISAFSHGGENGHGHDFSAFTEDVSDKQGVLRTFVLQTEQDVEELLSLQDTADKTGLQKILHRMSPAWTLLQSDEPLSDFCAFLKTGSCNSESIKTHVQRIAGHAALLIKEAENEIKRLTDET